MKRSRGYGLFFAALLASGMPASAERPEFAWFGMWNNRYVSEGIDNLDGAALYSTEFMAVWRNLDAGVWYALSDTADYRELNTFAAFNHTVGFLDLHAGYTHLQFDLGPEEEHAYDHELHAGAALNSFWLRPAVEYVHSTEAEGGIAILMLSAEQAFFNERLMVGVELAQLFDLGYVSESYDGDNNTELGFLGGVRVMSRALIFVEAYHSWAGTNLRRDGLGDVSWFGSGIQIGF